MNANDLRALRDTYDTMLVNDDTWGALLPRDYGTLLRVVLDLADKLETACCTLDITLAQLPVGWEHSVTPAGMELLREWAVMRKNDAEWWTKEGDTP